MVQRIAAVQRSVIVSGSVFLRPQASTLSVRMSPAPNSRAVLLEARLDDHFATATASLKVDPLEVTHTMSAISRMSLGYGAIRAGDSLDPVQDFGARLFDLLFDGPLSQLYLQVAIAEAEGRMTRIVLQVDDDLLSGFPWELMFDRRSGAFVALSARTPVMRRHVDLLRPVKPPKTNPSVLRVLPISADAERLADPVADQRLFDELKRVFGSRLEVLPPIDLTADVHSLAEALSRGPCDVLHFSGTGNFGGDDAAPSRREFINLGQGRKIAVAAVSRVLEEFPPAVLFLSSHNSGWFARQWAPLVPLVIGLHGLVSIESTATFERVFYDLLLAGESAATAITRARQTLHARGTAVRDWALIMAYSQADDLELVTSPDPSELVSEVPMYGSERAVEKPADRASARKWTLLQRRKEILGTNLAALRARSMWSPEVAEQIRSTEEQIEKLDMELRSLGGRDGA